jgi:hypothetical protein
MGWVESLVGMTFKSFFMNWAVFSSAFLNYVLYTLNDPWYIFLLLGLKLPYSTPEGAA